MKRDTLTMLAACLLFAASTALGAEGSNIVSYGSAAARADNDGNTLQPAQNIRTYNAANPGTFYSGGGLTSSGFDVYNNYTGQGYASDSYIARDAFDAFRTSYKLRLGANSLRRDGLFAGNVGSGRGYAMAPASAYTPIVNRFTVWADGYGTWTKQGTIDGNDGYRYSAGGPVLGGEWTNGSLTLGLAAAYGWGTARAIDTSNRRDVENFALAAYGQWTRDNFYINADVGYGHNRYKSSRDLLVAYNPTTLAYERAKASYNSDSWNLGTEAGATFRAGDFDITPNIGLRYFDDSRGAFDESGSLATLRVDKQGYHTLELPVGVDFGYEIHSGGMVFVPTFSFAWVPELDRNVPSSGAAFNGYGGAYNGYTWENAAPNRSRHGFEIGTGVQARINERVNLHLDYNLELRPHSAYNHQLNGGVGISF